jgi:hypothetical protein
MGYGWIGMQIDDLRSEELLWLFVNFWSANCFTKRNKCLSVHVNSNYFFECTSNSIFPLHLMISNK